MNHHHLVTRAQMLAYDRVGSVPNALPVVSVHRDSHMIPSRNGNVPVWCGSLRGDITHSDEKDRSERGKPTKRIRALTGNNTHRRIAYTQVRAIYQTATQRNRTRNVR
jgi:hypothetical protein